MITQKGEISPESENLDSKNWIIFLNMKLKSKFSFCADNSPFYEIIFNSKTKEWFRF